MRLTDNEKRMLDKQNGEAIHLAMAILTDLGDAVGAETMVEISQVHTDSGFYLGDAGLDFVEHLASTGGTVSVTTTMNNTSFDIHKGESYGVSPALMGKIRRLEKAHLKMGVVPTWTCAPYHGGILPKFGEAVAWSESNAIVFANSVIGARTNRTGDLVDICAAIAGRCPRFGLYLTENRKADMVLQLDQIPLKMRTDEAFYPLLGYLLGEIAGDRVAAIQGVPDQVDMDVLKHFGAAAASSGPVALFHMVGVTPEALTLEMCLKDKKALDTISVTPGMIQGAEEKLWTTSTDNLDWVAFGCPHFSFAEFVKLSRLLRGRKIHPNLKATVFTSRAVYAWVKENGILKSIEASGIDVYTDGCLLLYPQEIKPGSVMMTNSGKAANYIYSQSGLEAAFGGLEDCVESAVNGKIQRRCNR